MTYPKMPISSTSKTGRGAKRSVKISITPRLSTLNAGTRSVICLTGMRPKIFDRLALLLWISTTFTYLLIIIKIDEQMEVVIANEKMLYIKDNGHHHKDPQGKVDRALHYQVLKVF